MPPAHGTYQELDLELLDPSDEDELRFLIEAQHLEAEAALRNDEEMIIEPFSPRLHVTLHQVVANQLLADDPPRHGRPFSGSPAWATTGTTSCT